MCHVVLNKANGEAEKGYHVGIFEKLRSGESSITGYVIVIKNLILRFQQILFLLPKFLNRVLQNVAVELTIDSQEASGGHYRCTDLEN